MLNQNYKISGQLVNKANKPLSNLRIEAWDKDLLVNDFVGESTTDSDGRFEINFTQAYYRELFFDNRPDLYFKIYQEDKMIHSTENSILWNIDNEQNDLIITIEVEEDSKPTEEDIMLNFFKVHLNSQKLQNDFERLHKAFNGNWIDIKQKLIKDTSFSPELIKKLEFTNQLADWGDNNELLVTLFDNESQTNSMREIALQFNREEFISRVQSTAPRENENKIEYSEKLYEQLFFLEPTAMLINIAKDSRVPFLNDSIGKSVISVLEKQPDFNIKTTSIYELINNEEFLNDIEEDVKEEVKSQLKVMQRIVVVSPNPIAISALYNANFHSASQIASLPGEQFTTMMLSAGLERNISDQIQANAQQIVAHNEQTLISLKEVKEGTGIAFIDKSLYTDVNERLILNSEALVVNDEEFSLKKRQDYFNNFFKKNNLSWDLLFGDADFCQCDECTSMYSPAAYYVELLQYLRNNNLDPDKKKYKNTGEKGIAGTPLEKLFLRRPDLGCLELTCKNTNTILPYVDLVNEVMENYVAFEVKKNYGAFKTTKSFNVEDETSGELLAEPQHTNKDAYIELSDSVYPLTLPYHQPIDAARIYLNHLGTSRHELIETFDKNADSELSTRAYDAEFLGLTEQEYIILTKESFKGKEINQTKAQYESGIGVQSVYSYYGYKSDIEWKNGNSLKKIKDEFLKRADIDYVNLVELLKTEYLNPNMPKGTSKAIMESVANKYSYLLEYANDNSLEKMAEVIIFQVTEYESSSIENGDAPHCEVNAAVKGSFYDEDIIEWATKEFVKIGKLIVIESGSIDSCNLNTAVLQHLDGTSLDIEEYDRIHRFIRLWRKLGWTIDETDKAIIGLSVNTSEPESQPDINANLIHQLVSVKKLLKTTGLELIKLLTFWTDINTTGENSLYHRLFLTHNLVRLDSVFNADGAGNFLTGDIEIVKNKPVLMAALNLSSEDIDMLLLEKGDSEKKLTLKNVSELYRYRLLSKTLGLKIVEFADVPQLFGNIFENAAATLKFLETWARIEDSGLSLTQLHYIIGDVNNEESPLAPSQKETLLLTKVLYDGLNAIEAAHKDLIGEKENREDEATSELVISKASLLLEPAIVDKIINFLEGTTIYSTTLHLDPQQVKAITVNKKLTYKSTSGIFPLEGILTVKGILSEDENKILQNPEWNIAIEKIRKQKEKLFKELFIDNSIIDDTKDYTTKQMILSGDISSGKPEELTAPKKRLAFLAVFLPYLRKELSHRFIIDALAGKIGLEDKLINVLVTQILKHPSSDPAAEPIYTVFAKIKEQGKLPENDWNGYLIPPTTGIYKLIVNNTDTYPNVTFDGDKLQFELEEDSTNKWWNDDSLELELEAGKLYTLSTLNTPIENIYWKKSGSSITTIPTSALIPDFASADCKIALNALNKATMIVSTFKLSADEIRFLNGNKAFANLDFNNLTLDNLLRLESYTRLRNSLPQNKLNLLDFFRWVNDKTNDPAILSNKIADVTGWKEKIVFELIDHSHFNINKDAFNDEIQLLKLQHAIEVVDKIGMDIDSLFNWADQNPDSNLDPNLDPNIGKFNYLHEVATSLKNAIRAKYNQTDWEQVIRPAHDLLRNNQKDALIAYLLQQQELLKWKVTDAEGLFEYFLIDVQMDAVMETSRIKQAISSVQLFVQRCFLGLEEKHNKILPEFLNRSRWEWMQRYRLWEANRKVFLYPENWIETNLRDDKSPFFKELESELLQKDINKQNVSDALKSYLYKVDEVANMEVIGLYIEGEIENRAWSTGAKLHVFSRTRNTPSFFYYRYLALDEMNWYPWEKMDVDINCYDVEDDEKRIINNGCYIMPVVWNNRLLVFFPQIVNKSISNSAIQNITIEKSATKTPHELRPSKYHEIKMAWSEYKNENWTQKQISKVSAINYIYEYPDFPNISRYVFLPTDSIENPSELGIEIIYDKSPKSYVFTFDGATVDLSFNFLGRKFETYYLNHEFNFHYWKNILFSLQEGYFADISAPFEIFNSDSHGSSIKIQKINQPFFNNYPSNFLGNINLPDLEEFFKNNTKDFNFGLYIDSKKAASTKIYHELKSPYSLYNWELFFHTPMTLADSLSKAQQFEEAMKWYHYVFNPVPKEGFDDKRFWQFSPFKEIDSKNILEAIFNHLEPNTPDQAINEWRNKPFMPHVVARSRPVAYMKWVVMKYIDNLVAWGDYLFRQDTIESINQATQLYVLAGHILGPRPMMIPKKGKTKPQTYLSLLNKWDASSNAMTELELTPPFSSQTPIAKDRKNKELTPTNIFGQASSLYFCIPKNPKLLAYWDTLSDRLFKIRHSQNIEGVFRKMALFEPPIDPALLVKAAAQGLSIASVLNDLNTPMPNYRFYYLLQKALELCNELKSLGGALLSALEKKDNETIALLRSKHENVMNALMLEIKKKQLQEAHKNLESLEQNRKGPEERMKYYLKLSGLDENLLPAETADFSGLVNEISTVDGESGLKLNAYEKEDMDKAANAHKWQMRANKIEALSALFHALPDSTIMAAPLGVGVKAELGGSHFGNASNALSKIAQIYSSQSSFESSHAAKKGGFQRAYQDRIQQANTAGFELKQIDKQITAQKIRIEIANQEINNQQQLMENALEVEDFLKNKFTNEELYTWMRGSLKTLYHQVYGLTYELAKKAEKVYRFERGISSSNFIQSGYWDAGRNGLLAGEQLYVGLKQMEAAYQNERGHDYEITKHISLQQINPMALIVLRETGKCEFAFPEIFFDMDYPGHYKRRIKSISISIPCIVGPYTGVNASLRLLENKFRNTAITAENDYEEKTEEEDNRFSRFIIPITAIAASSAQNDSGMFELNFKDERYLPFEGAGVISKWRLELPDIRQFNYQTISDVIIHVRYTSNEGGEKLKSSAHKSLLTNLKNTEKDLSDNGLSVLINLKHDMPNEWHLLKQNGLVQLIIDKSRLPYMIQSIDTKPEIENISFIAKVPDNSEILINGVKLTEPLKIGNLNLYSKMDIGVGIAIPFNISITDADKQNLEELLFIVKYKFK